MGWRPLAADLSLPTWLRQHPAMRGRLDSNAAGVPSCPLACHPGLQGVRWAEDVVDNEHMNKKKSKSEHGSRVAAAGNHGGGAARSTLAPLLPSALLHGQSADASCPAPLCAECCIFHRQRQFGEWSDDEDSDAECDECGEGSSQPPEQPQAPPPQT